MGEGTGLHGRRSSHCRILPARRNRGQRARPFRRNARKPIEEDLEAAQLEQQQQPEVWTQFGRALTLPCDKVDRRLGGQCYDYLPVLFTHLYNTSKTRVEGSIDSKARVEGSIDSKTRVEGSCGRQRTPPEEIGAIALSSSSRIALIHISGERTSCVCFDH